MRYSPRTRVETAKQRAELRSLLYACTSETIEALRRNAQWPLRDYEWPNLIGPGVPVRFVDRPARDQLARYLSDQPLADMLRGDGHTWAWHYKAMPELFIERVLRRTFGGEIREDVFDAVFADLLSELHCHVVSLRQVSAVHGFAAPRRTAQLAPGLRLQPYAFSQSHVVLWDLLHMDRQREVNRWVEDEGVFLIQDVSVPKSGEGQRVLDRRRALIAELQQALGALRLARSGLVTTSTTWTVQLSRFPMLPPDRFDNPDAELVHYGVHGGTDARFIESSETSVCPRYTKSE
jgi:hypothetical protein